MKNSIELLPKSIEFTDGRYYEIRIYLTAWNKLCICYYNPFDASNIFSCVVEGENKIEKAINGNYEDIYDATDLDDAVDITLRRITYAQIYLGEEIIKIVY